MTHFLRNISFGIFCVSALALRAQTHPFVIEAGKLGAPIQHTMYGLFFEDINYAADGGLYAELVKNRSFEFPNALQGWRVAGKVEVKNDGPFERNPHYVRLYDAGHAHKHTVIENEGFLGMGIKNGEDYRFTVWARSEGQATLAIELFDLAARTPKGNQTIVKERININSTQWQKYEVVLHAAQTFEKANLRILLEGKASVDLEHVSLFPVHTWKDRSNGLRKDLVQALADLKPGVFRFPGGCIVEGTEPDDRYQWKNTVGAVENRPLNLNRWQYTFTSHFFADYYQSCGLGFYEYFQLAEDLGAEPLPVLNCGLVCQYQNDPDQQIATSELDEYIQDAIDLIEFANGDVTTTWGKLRAEMGHPDPFNLKLLAVGNEQWGTPYTERLEPFVKALRKAHPEIKIVGSAGPNSEGDEFDYLWPEMRRMKADLVDEHFYRPESWFLSQGARYDNYDRKGPKVFAGEYACHGKDRGFNHFNAALMEAAFMTGLERNADVVHMATYAPLFAHVEGWQWRPDLIWFNNLNVVRTASYYVQQLYSNYKGTNVLPLTMNKQPVTGAEGQDGLFASAVYDQPQQAIYIKVANTSNHTQGISMTLNGLKKKVPTGGECIKLQATDPLAENTLTNPRAVVPQRHSFAITQNNLNIQLEANTFAVYIIRY